MIFPKFPNEEKNVGRSDTVCTPFPEKNVGKKDTDIPDSVFHIGALREERKLPKSESKNSSASGIGVSDMELFKTHREWNGER